MDNFDRQSIVQMNQKLEVDLIGIARIDDIAPKEVRKSAESLLPGVKSAVVFAKEIFREIIDLLAPSKEVGAAEPGALLPPHYAYLTGRLTKATYDFSHMLRNEGYRCLPLPSVGCPTDQRNLVALFSYKHAAVAAGLGCIGRNGLLITEAFGPRVRLAALLTDAPFEPTEASKKDTCKDCHACIRACPAQALELPKDESPYAINKFACRTYRETGLTCSMCMKACAAVHT